jgi:catechol 2,3-dioxygenase-like lactoylglutathione lyase family enzyme
VIDHVTIRVPDLRVAAAFYDDVFRQLEFPGEPYDGGELREWNDFSIARATADRPPTRGLHVGFAADARERVDRWWDALTAAGHPSDGAPGPRPEYGPRYYGAFVLDPAGNSVEAVHDPPRRNPGVIDHLWLRVRSLPGATRFYETVCPHVGYEVRHLPGRTQIRGEGAGFSLLEGPPTEHVHLAFAAPDRDTVDAFHEAGTRAGYRSLGAPGERPEYHQGYYGAYLADADGHNVEAVFHDRAAG